MINRLKLEKYSALYLWAFFMILFWFWRPDNFMTITSFKLVTQENVIFAVLALAFLVPLSTATYDLAIGHQASMALVITNWIAKNTELPQATGILLGLGACLIAGTISGFVVVKLKVDSFIATLGMSQVITAFILYTSEQTISGELSKPYQQFGNAQSTLNRTDDVIFGLFFGRDHVRLVQHSNPIGFKISVSDDEKISEVT